MDESDFQNPYDELNWRWERARALSKSRPDKSDDRFVIMAWRFLRDLRDVKEKVGLYDLMQRHKSVGSAFSWHTAKSERRNFIEALSLCSDLSLEDEAKYLAVDVDVLAVYERLFFDVRDRRDEKGFLCSRILEPAVVSELRDFKSPVYAWKVCAIFGGFKVVKACWEYGNPEKGVNEFHQRAGVAQMIKNFGLASFFRPVNAFSAADISDHIVKVMDIEVRRNALSGQSEAMQNRADIISQVLSCIQFCKPAPNAPALPAREPRLFEALRDAAEAEARNTVEVKPDSVVVK